MASSQRALFKNSFENVKFLCATSDIWSRSNKSFIAVSVHYFDDDLTLKSKFIACEYFPGRHTHDKVAAKLKSIFERYAIWKKVSFVTTDGAGEYTAAFKYFGDNYQSIYLSNADEDNLRWLDGNGTDDVGASAAIAGTDLNSNDRSVSASNTELESDVEDDDLLMRIDADQQSDSHMNVAPILAAGDGDRARNQSNSFQLHELPNLLGDMNRIDCAAHKLDKLGKIDALNAKNIDPNYAQLYDRVFDKLNKIWSQKKSRLSSEIFLRITGKNLIGPHRIRWLKLCQAVSATVKYFFFFFTFDIYRFLVWFLFATSQVENILSINQAKLESACIHLEIDALDEEEYEFLLNHYRIISLVATALKTLEADKYTFGLYLPTLIGLKLKLSALLEKENSVQCVPLIIALQSGLESRFGGLMDPFNENGNSVPLYVAMLSNPTFKMNFLGIKKIPANLLGRFKDMLFKAATDMNKSEYSKRTVSDQADSAIIDTPTATQGIGLFLLRKSNVNAK